MYCSQKARDPQNSTAAVQSWGWRGAAPHLRVVREERGPQALPSQQHARDERDQRQLQGDRRERRAARRAGAAAAQLVAHPRAGRASNRREACQASIRQPLGDRQRQRPLPPTCQQQWMFTRLLREA